MINNKEKKPVFWIGINAYQGLALLEICKKRKLNYHIICLEKESIYKNLKKGGAKIFCLEEKTGINNVPRNTGHILAHKETIKYIKYHSGGQKPIIVFFKPSAKISFVCKKHHWLMAGNNHKLAEFLENKLSFYLWATKNKLPLIPGEIRSLDIKYLSKKKFPFIIQFKRGWAGKSSFIINSKNDLNKLKKFAGQLVKISPFLKGETYINNGCILRNGQVLVGPPGKQISKINELSNNPLSTTGRQWPATIKNKDAKIINKITDKLGALIYKKGYRGFFGTDFLIDNNRNIYLLECNPRLTASFVFYTQLEEQSSNNSLLWHHLNSFALFSDNKTYQSTISGSEIIQRNNQKKTLKITTDINSGHFSLNGKIIDNNLNPQNSLLLVCRPKGSIVQSGDEVFKIISKKPLVGNNGNLLLKINQLRKLILSKLTSEQEN
jgi:hypothetical protein